MSGAYAVASTDDRADYVAASSSSSRSGQIHTVIPGVTPTGFLVMCFVLLGLYVLYLLLPRGVRVDRCGAYPKRYAWSERTLRRRERQRRGGRAGGRGGGGGGGASSLAGSASLGTVRSHESGPGFGLQPQGRVGDASRANGDDAILFLSGGGVRDEADLLSTPMDGSSSYVSGATGFTGQTGASGLSGAGGMQAYASGVSPSPYRRLGAQGIGVPLGAVTGGGGTGGGSAGSGGVGSLGSKSIASLIDNENEVYVSATMQQLRDSGVRLIAHGSKGKPKRVRLRLTVDCIAWRTELLPKKGGELKLGKLHRVPLSHILYVDVGKQTTALRRVENASVPDGLCFSLLTRDGSLDLETASARERDALVSCFSLVLDEVHAKDWRDVTGRAPSPSEMMSSFDEGENEGDGRRDSVAVGSRGDDAEEEI